MADKIDINDPEYLWTPRELPPATGPELAAMRLDSIEQRIANLERGRGDIGRQLTDADEAIRVAIDALTYLAGSVERVRALVEAQAATPGA